MKTAVLDGNEFTGIMPSSICKRNYNVLQADCGGGLDAKVQCSCCTYCRTTEPNPISDQIVLDGINRGEQKPSTVPSETPSAQPTLSHMPTISMVPTASSRPSEFPSDQPSLSQMPTVSAAPTT
eukprot:6727261-Ditylum_brightwellii.AAC.1